MIAASLVVVALVCQCLSSIQGAGLAVKDVDGGWSGYRPTYGCRMQRDTNSNNTMWAGWPTKTWPPDVDSDVDICFYTWQQTMTRTCTNPRRHGKGKRCEGNWKKEVPCKCPYKVDPIKDCEQAITNKDRIQGFVSDPCRCSCFYHCYKVDGVWTVPPVPQCCPPCTFWSGVTLGCTRVLEGCEKVKPKEDNNTKQETKQNLECTLKKDNDDKHMFWNGPHRMTCPPNTVFSFGDCGCLLEFDPLLIRDVTCLSFDNGYNGLSATHGVWVHAKKVKVVDGGVKGKCGYFNGSSSLAMPYFSGSYGRYEQFAISFFFKREAGSTGSVGIMSNGDCATKDYSSMVVTSPNNGTVRAGFKNVSGTITEQIVGEVSAGEWHYMVLSWDGSNVKIFVDAKEKFAGLLEGRLDVPNCPITIGVTRGLYGVEYFKGYMDEICFYKTSLKQDEIKDMHEKPGKVYYSYNMPADLEK